MNRLAAEPSPYLQQHAENPVDWYPFGAEAFEAARARDVPVLLSVGYSACHWCHVMAHESFEDPGVAEVMNAGFVNVKVDREERPDVDAVYMEAVQALTGSGGWPMTVFLLPDGRPFYGGTYYPRARFLALLQQVSRAWAERRSELEAAAEQLAEAVRAGTALPRPAQVEPSGEVEPGQAAAPEGSGGGTGRWAALLGRAAALLLARHDPQWGGFGQVPKFPQPQAIELLLLAHAEDGDPSSLAAATTTLDAMSEGGIYDHLGGGFARYSTDRQWLVPHFEKMLYDNALLARTYLHAWQLTGDRRYRQVLSETLGYLLRPPMRLPDGGFASAEDADSEGVEGLFYTWPAAEVAEVGGQDAVEWYCVTPQGNFEGRNILHRPRGAGILRPPRIEEARRALFERREARLRPGLDDKVLTEWNAMAVAALAEAGGALGEQAWLEAASDTASFLLASLRRPDGRLLRSWRAGQARHLGTAADYAWLLEALVRLAEATGKPHWLEEARMVAEGLLRLFWDPEEGGFATTGSDAEALIARPKDSYDGAMPSANSVAAGALLRLGALTGDSSCREVVGSLLEAMAAALDRAPAAFSGLVAAAYLFERGMEEVVVTGERRDLVSAVLRRFRPSSVLAWGEPFDSPLWEGRTSAAASGLAYVCRNYACEAPVSSVEALESLLARS